MPMRSQAQRAYLHAKKPGIAARFEAETPKGAPLPKRVAPKVPPGGKFVPIKKR